MLPEKTGIKNILRTPARSVLFVLLFSLMTAMLSLGFCVFGAISDYLAACDDYYHSIAELEYIGSEYPDTHVRDDALAAALDEDREVFAEIAALPGSEGFAASDSALCDVPGLTRTDQQVYDVNEAVLECSIMTYDSKSGAYVGSIRECLHSADDNTGLMIFISPEGIDSGEAGTTLEKGASYLLSGCYFSGRSSYIWFRVTEYSCVMNGESVEIPTWCRAEESSDEELIRYLARVMDARDNGFRIERIADLEYYRPFQQEELKLSSGRKFSEEEYETAAKVVILSSKVAETCGAEVGDRITLEILDGGESIYDPDLTASPEEAECEVVGIFDATDECSDLILMPSDQEKQEMTCPTGYAVGTYRLDNRLAESFHEAAQEILPEGFRLTLYDQGYSSASEPYREMQKIAVLFLVVTMIVMIAVLALYCSLFVLRQEEEVRTMRFLGTGTVQIVRHFLTGALCIFAIAAPLGILLGRSLESRVLGMIADFAAQFESLDNRYSSGALTIVRKLEFSPEKGIGTFFLAALCLLLLLLVFVLAFSVIAIRNTDLVIPGRSGKKRTRAGKKSGSGAVLRGAGSSRLNGILKYGILSARRGGARSLAAVFLSCAALVFFGALSASSNRQAEQLEAVRTGTKIRGNVTDKSGKALSGVVLSSDLAKKLIDTGMLSDVTYGKNECHYRLLGVSVTADGAETGLPEYVFPTSSFAVETLLNQLAHEPMWVTANRISGTPEFFYEDAPEIDWLDGRSEADLSGNDGSVCVISSTMASREGIEKGDTIRVLTDESSNEWGGSSFSVFELQVIGIYTPVSADETLYTPCSFSFSEEDQEDGEEMRRTSFHFFTFSVEDGEELPELREKLAQTGIEPAKSDGTGRSFLVLWDASYLSTVQSMTRQQKYTVLLFGFLKVLVLITAFFAAWLLALSRRSEITTMQLLGTGRARVLLNFTAEQLVLSAVGGLAGFLVGCLVIGAPLREFWIPGAVFLVLWQLGTVVSVLRQCAGGGQTGTPDSAA